MHSHIAQLTHRLCAVRFDDICDCDNADQLIAPAEKQRRFSLLCELLRLFLQRCRNLTNSLHKCSAAAVQGNSIQCGRQSMSRQCLKFLHIRCRYRIVLRPFYNRTCQRMFALFFQSIRQRHNIAFGVPVCRNQIGNFGLSGCNGTGFIQRNNGNLSGFFERNSGLKQNAVFCALAVADHDGNRRCQAQRTRTADNQNRNAARQCKTEGLSAKQPDNAGNHGNRDNRRNKHTGYFIRNFCNRRLCRRRVTDHLNNL